MAFTTLSTVSAYEEEKCLVRSGKDIMSGYLAKDVEILGKVCGDTWQSMWRYLVKYVDILEMGSKHLYVMSYEMRVCFLSVIGGILESFVGESFQFFRR